MIDFIEKLAPIILSVGLTAWVYQTLNSVIKSLREEIKQLSEDIDNLKKDLISERGEKNKWYRKYYKLLNLIKRFSNCKTDCPLTIELQNHLSDEGETL